MSIRILIIEDDDLILATLEELFCNEGYEVYYTKFGESGRKMVLKHRPDLIILDWMLPDTTGLEICKMIRSETDTPILMITGRKSVEDRVLAFDYGADDFMGKPFHYGELLARSKALLRRSKWEYDKFLMESGLVLDSDRIAAWRKERLIQLTIREYKILELFVENPKRVITKDEILEINWGDSAYEDENVVDAYVHYLQNKLEKSGESRIIHKVQDIGYIMK
jgi:two-component system response regulator MprA